MRGAAGTGVIALYIDDAHRPFQFLFAAVFQCIQCILFVEGAGHGHIGRNRQIALPLDIIDLPRCELAAVVHSNKVIGAVT